MTFQESPRGSLFSKEDFLLYAWNQLSFIESSFHVLTPKPKAQNPKPQTLNPKP